MPNGSVVILPHVPASLACNSAVADLDRRSLAAELIAYGLPVHQVPPVEPTEADLDARSATAHWIAHIAMDLTASQPDRPVLLVAYGGGGPMLPALGFSQKASRRPVSGYVVIDDALPKPGAADWPDAPVSYVQTTDDYADEAHQAELRGWTVERDADVGKCLRRIFMSL